MRRRFYITLLIISVIGVGVFSVLKHEKSNQTQAYKDLLSGDIGISSIEFDGQMKNIKINDPVICEDLKQSFVSSGLNTPRSGGLTYAVIIYLDSGTKIKTCVYLYKDKSGFDIADNSRMGAGDQTYVSVGFSASITQRTRDLVVFLLGDI